MKKISLMKMEHSGGGIKSSVLWYLYQLSSGDYMLTDNHYELGESIPKEHGEWIYPNYQEAFKRYQDVVY